MGRVSNVDNTPGSLYLEVTVDPFASTENYEEVIVITSLTEGQEATADDIKSADSQETSSSSSSSDSGSDDSSDKSSASDEAQGSGDAGSGSASSDGYSE